MLVLLGPYPRRLNKTVFIFKNWDLKTGWTVSLKKTQEQRNPLSRPVPPQPRAHKRKFYPHIDGAETLLRDHETKPKGKLGASRPRLSEWKPMRLGGNRLECTWMFEFGRVLDAPTWAEWGFELFWFAFLKHTPHNTFLPITLRPEPQCVWVNQEIWDTLPPLFF